MSKPLITNGLIPAEGFPVKPYEDIYQKVVTKWEAHELYDQFAGAWTAVSYRFQGMMEASSEFKISLAKYGSTPPANERYRQDQKLADLFGNAFSTLESIFYGLFAVGTFLDPANFSLSTPKSQKLVTPAYTTVMFKKAFASDPFLMSFDVLFDDPRYADLRDIRNVLVHRSAPGRRMYVSIGGDEAPPTEWKLNNIPIDASLVQTRTENFSALITEFLSAMHEFIDRKV